MLDAFIHLSPLIAMQVCGYKKTQAFVYPVFGIFFDTMPKRGFVVSKQNGGVPSQVGSMDPSKIQF